MLTTHAAMATMVTLEICSWPPNRLTASPETTEVNVFGLEDQISSAAFCKKYEMPIAVMSTASDGAIRSGLYARRSMTTPSAVQTMTASTTPAHAGQPR